MVILNAPTHKERLELILKHAESLENSRTFINLTDELYLAEYFGVEYVDAHGYDFVDKVTGEKAEAKTCGVRDKLNAQWTGLNSKQLADTLILWDKVTGAIVKMPMKEAEFFINAGGKITARLTDNPPLEENQTRRPFSKRTLKLYQMFLSYTKN